MSRKIKKTTTSRKAESDSRPSRSPFLKSPCFAAPKTSLQLIDNWLSDVSNSILEAHQGPKGPKATIRREFEEAAQALKQKWAEIILDPTTGPIFIIEDEREESSRGSGTKSCSYRPTGIIKDLMANDDWEGLEGLKLGLDIMVLTFFETFRTIDRDAYDGLMTKLLKARSEMS